MLMAHGMETLKRSKSAPVGRLSAFSAPRKPTAAAVRHALESDETRQLRQAQQHEIWFATFMWWFNTSYFTESAAGLAYQNGQQFAYTPTDLAIYLPVMAAWMVFAGAAARAQHQAEQGDANNL